MRYQVRFHLGKGQHYQHWQVKSLAGVRYYDPEKVSLSLRDCHLRNHSGAARKIFDGGNKSVCAWIDCNDFTVGSPAGLSGSRVSYNPRVSPHWRGAAGENLDGVRLEALRTAGRSVFCDAEGAAECLDSVSQEVRCDI